MDVGDNMVFKIKIKDETINLNYNDLLMIWLACIPLNIAVSYFIRDGINIYIPHLIFYLFLIDSYILLYHFYGERIVTFLNNILGDIILYDDYKFMELINGKFFLVIIFFIVLNDIIIDIMRECFVFGEYRLILIVIPFIIVGKYKLSLLYCCIMTFLVYISFLLDKIPLIIILAIIYYLSIFCSFQMFYSLIIKFNSEFSKLIPFISYYD